MSTLPLARFKVIDLTRALAGPSAVRQLADWGAQIIKVESPKGDGELGGARNGHSFQNRHCNKRSITLDLKSPGGLEVLYRLVEDADVVVENFRPAVKHQLKIDYETLRKINPRLVYGSVSGFGQDGPYSNRPGFDQIAQGMGGLMSITGRPGGGPMRAGIPVGDLTAGIFCALGIVIALLEREESDEGQWVQSSLLESIINLLEYQATVWTVDKKLPPQSGNDHPFTAPTGVFKTADGQINIGATGNLIYRRLCSALGAERLASDPDFVTDDLRKKRPRTSERGNRGGHENQNLRGMAGDPHSHRRAERTDLPGG